MARERPRKPNPNSGRKAPAEPSRPLTPKQAAFVREYLVDSNAPQAAVRSGYDLGTRPTGYYAYVLIDPRDGRIFYVGKGKGRRMHAHASASAMRDTLRAPAQ